MAPTALESGPRASSDSTLRVLLRALWVARVPVASIIGALLIFSVAEGLDLFVDIPPGQLARFRHWALFYVVAFIFWIWPANFSARLALQLNHERIGVDSSKRYSLIVIALPRLLSVICFVVLFYGFWRAGFHVPTFGAGKDELGISADARQHLRFASYWALGLCVLTTLAYFGLARLSVLQGRRLRRVSPRLYDMLDRALIWAKPKRRRLERPLFDAETQAAQHDTLVGVLLLLTSIFAVNIVLAVISLTPSITAQFPSLDGFLPRAVFVPVLLGISVPGFALLGVLSHRFRFPLILAFFVVVSAYGTLREDRHYVRIDWQPTAMQRITLDEAVKRWKAANCGEGKKCRPIIVAGSGGASRAAFMTGNALAYLHDTSPAFSRQLFAISSISGSSLGAAAFVAGLDRKEALRGDCGDRRFDSWFACHENENARKVRAALEGRPLQKRMQLFLANDFLTPAMVTFTFSDLWRLFDDRAAKLEKSWEIGWNSVTESGPADRGDFARRLSSFVRAGTASQSGGDDWRPLLILNGSSVGTGRRIIVSSLEPVTNSKRIFVDAHDFYEMACLEDGKPPHCDLRLSTAVTMSARFPLISPAGGIVRGNRNGPVVDRVVDGGYFENFGAQTALELARVLQHERYGLKPFVLQISNDPSVFDSARCQDPEIKWDDYFQGQKPKLAFGDRSDLLRWASDIGNAVLAARTARGTHATAAALATVGQENYAHIRVCPQRMESDASLGWITSGQEMLHDFLVQRGWASRNNHDEKREDAFKELSASWWLSPPVQQYLHAALEAQYNCAEIRHLREALDPPDAAFKTARAPPPDC
jgi:hypothetical protein